MSVQVIHMSPMREIMLVLWPPSRGLRITLTSIGNSSNRGVEEGNSTAVGVKIDAIKTSSLGAVVVHLDAVSSGSWDQLSIRPRVEDRERTKHHPR